MLCYSWPYLNTWFQRQELVSTISQILLSTLQGIALSPRQSSSPSSMANFLIISLASNTTLFHNYHACHFQVSPFSHILFTFIWCLQSVFYSLFTLVSKVMDTNMQLEGRDRNLEEQDSIDRQGSKKLFFCNVLAKRKSSEARVSLASL
jgi:hypothetical protein